MNKKTIIILIIIAAIVIPVGIYIASPLFINTTVNEPPPTSGLTDLQKFQEFMSMNNEQKRVEEGQQMTTEEKNAILRGAAQTNGSTVNQNMTEAEITLGYPSLLIGEFVGTSDDITSKSGFFVSLFECKRS
jgi:flagellar basal body-associated protein FliL